MSTTVITTQSSPLHPSLYRSPSSSSSSSSTSHIHTIHDSPSSSSSSSSFPPHSPLPISPSVLSLHLGPRASVLPSSPSSCAAWTAIGGEVYDITQFLGQHPGGSVIQLAAGRDSSALIESYHPKESMVRVMAAIRNKCQYIGPLQGYQQPMNCLFFQTIQLRVSEALLHKGYHYQTYEYYSIVESFISLLLFLVSTYYCCIRGSILSAVCCGILTARMGFLMHTGNHCASSSNVWLNEMIGLFMNVIGSSHLIWRHEHQVAHHLDPNELSRDNDCSIGNPFIRMHPHLPSHPWQRWQHITVPIAITFGFIKWYISDFMHFMRGTVGSVSFAVDMKQWFILLPMKVIWFIIRILLPLYYFPLPHALLLIFLPLAIGAHYLENIFIVNHIQHGLVPPVEAHWAVKQVLGTSNWQSGSYFWNWFSGGLNHQIEHHLFPSMNIHLYPFISPVIKNVCEEFHLPYYSYPSFSMAYIDMLKYLKAMGNPNFIPENFTSELQRHMREALQTSSQHATDSWERGVPVRKGKGVKVGTKKTR